MEESIGTLGTCWTWGTRRGGHPWVQILFQFGHDDFNERKKKGDQSGERRYRGFGRNETVKQSIRMGDVLSLSSYGGIQARSNIEPLPVASFCVISNTQVV